jgi:hypothetical protein
MIPTAPLGPDVSRRSGSFDCVHSQVGSVQDFGCILAWFGEVDADASGHCDGLSVDEVRFGECVGDPVREQGEVGCGDAGRDDRELISAESGDRVVGPDRSTKTMSGGEQNFVASSCSADQDEKLANPVLNKSSTC